MFKTILLSEYLRDTNKKGKEIFKMVYDWIEWHKRNDIIDVGKIIPHACENEIYNHVFPVPDENGHLNWDGYNVEEKFVKNECISIVLCADKVCAIFAHDWRVELENNDIEDLIIHPNMDIQTIINIISKIISQNYFTMTIYMPFMKHHKIFSKIRNIYSPNEKYFIYNIFPTKDRKDGWDNITVKMYEDYDSKKELSCVKTKIKITKTEMTYEGCKYGKCCSEKLVIIFKDPLIFKYSIDDMYCDITIEHDGTIYTWTFNDRRIKRLFRGCSRESEFKTNYINWVHNGNNGVRDVYIVRCFILPYHAIKDACNLFPNEHMDKICANHMGKKYFIDPIVISFVEYIKGIYSDVHVNCRLNSVFQREQNERRNIR